MSVPTLIFSIYCLSVDVTLGQLDANVGNLNGLSYPYVQSKYQNRWQSTQPQLQNGQPSFQALQQNPNYQQYPTMYQQYQLPNNQAMTNGRQNRDEYIIGNQYSDGYNNAYLPLNSQQISYPNSAVAYGNAQPQVAVVGFGQPVNYGTTRATQNAGFLFSRNDVFQNSRYIQCVYRSLQSGRENIVAICEMSLGCCQNDCCLIGQQALAGGGGTQALIYNNNNNNNNDGILMGTKDDGYYDYYLHLPNAGSKMTGTTNFGFSLMIVAMLLLSMRFMDRLVGYA